MKRLLLLVITLLCVFNVKSQDIKYARFLIDTLSSKSFYGRAYTQNGAQNAAAFIAGEFEKFKLSKFNKSYFQEYHLSINTFPSELKISIGKKTLKPGTEFMVSLSSPANKGVYKTVKLDSTVLHSKADMDKMLNKNYSGKIVIIDKQNIKDKELNEYFQSIRNKNPFQSAGIAYITDHKLSWGTSDGKKVNNYFKLSLLRDALPAKIKKIEINLEAEYIKDYETRNVVAYVKGKLYPDSFYVFTAHYDHLGEMGNEVYFPGANDNASGTAMVMDLAKHFSSGSNQPDYSIVFALVSGEESGLYGSTYMASHPLFPLKNIKFLINIDMVGTGSEGITIVNGTKFENEFNKFDSINKEKAYLKTIAKRGESCNSDHCPFYEKGVPAIFIYAMGSEFTEYHNVYDVAKNLPLTKYNEIFKLMLDFVK
jgi:aminopeptidase YwaD